MTPAGTSYEQHDVQNEWEEQQPIMRIEDRLFDRGWVRSAMATRKCGNIYFWKYFMAVRKFTNIFVLLLILMEGSRDNSRLCELRIDYLIEDG